jgi:hypothetical protein
MRKTPLSVRLLLSGAILFALSAAAFAEGPGCGGRKANKCPGGDKPPKGPGCGTIDCKKIDAAAALAAVDELMEKAEKNRKRSKELKQSIERRDQIEASLRGGLSDGYASEFGDSGPSYRTYEEVAKALEQKAKFWDVASDVLLVERKKFNDDKPSKELDEEELKERIGNRKEAFKMSAKLSLIAAVVGDINADKKVFKEVTSVGDKAEDKWLRDVVKAMADRKADFFKSLKKQSENAK